MTNILEGTNLYVWFLHTKRLWFGFRYNSSINNAKNHDNNYKCHESTVSYLMEGALYYCLLVSNTYCWQLAWNMEEGEKKVSNERDQIF